MATAIAAWGNSDAIRIPRSLLREVGLRKGDNVELKVNESGRIEIVPEARAHRRVEPARDVTFDSLFKDYVPAACDPSADAWPGDEFVGAEREAWLA